MSRVKGQHTSPEIKLRKYLHRLGFRYRLHSSHLPGKPDLVFPAKRKVIFVHGCFWHGHGGCAKAGLPKSNVEFWRSKRKANRARDRRVIRELETLGWKVFVIWQCELAPDSSALASVVKFLR